MPDQRRVLRLHPQPVPASGGPPGPGGVIFASSSRWTGVSPDEHRTCRRPALPLAGSLQGPRRRVETPPFPPDPKLDVGLAKSLLKFIHLTLQLVFSTGGGPLAFSPRAKRFLSPFEELLLPLGDSRLAHLQSPARFHLGHFPSEHAEHDAHLLVGRLEGLSSHRVIPFSEPQSHHSYGCPRNLDALHQAYSYDNAGRLSQVQDTEGAQCTTRIYGYDADSNRISLTTTPSAGDGACSASGGTTLSSTYDGADRANKSGYVFDPLGRITALAGADNGGAAVSATYFANDRVNSLSQGGVTDTASLDPTYRIRQWGFSNNTSGTQTSHYTCDCDRPAWIAENSAGTAWTRDVTGPAGLSATVNQLGVATLQVSNLHGDIVATASTTSTATAFLTTSDQAEFGQPRQAGGERYGWLGGSQRAIDPATGATIMGQRVYMPRVGRFLQVDQVAGGSANAYDYVGQDPVNGRDLGGTYNVQCSDHFWGLQCTLWLGKKGTHSWASRGGFYIGSAYCVGFALINPVFGAACWAYVNWFALNAGWAEDRGECLKVDWYALVYSSPPLAFAIPRRYSGGYCR